LLRHEHLAGTIATFGIEVVTFAARQAIAEARSRILEQGTPVDLDNLVAHVERLCRDIAGPSLRRVINATGILIHTNLGRAPLGSRMVEEMQAAITGYNNLEFDLNTGSRGNRSVHLQWIFRFLTGAEDTLAVNNNAAALVLVLNTLAKDREVIISRGELIEIGGSFRIPEIMSAAGVHMVEVGTTNRTRISDYERAITERTALLFKAHKSNYAIRGFTEEPTLEELVDLGRTRHLPALYDIGSGLLRKPANLPLTGEPDVKGAIAAGVDLVTFSGDKLLGGPQAGIIAGRRDLVARLARAPLMRALRVGKLTIAALSCAARAYLDDARLLTTIPLFTMMESDRTTLRRRAELLQARLADHGIRSEITDSIGHCGGGTLPDLDIPSFAVTVKSEAPSQQKRSEFADQLFRKLLHLDIPVLAILRQGELAFDVLTLEEADLLHVASALAATVSAIPRA